ncbi:MAG: hypothetical protein ACFB51_13295 [Anaerolineae bacterium]
MSFLFRARVFLGKVRRRLNWRKLGIFAGCLLLFVIALEFMKTGAGALSPILTEWLKVDNPINSLGFGWLASYLVLGGSPVAASALTFLNESTINAASAFAMISGSRLGASSVVLIIGFIYILRGHERGTSLITGLLALVVTASVYLFALPMGLWLIGMDLPIFTPEMNGAAGESMLVMVLGLPVEFAEQFLPEWALFLVGLGLIITSLNLFDQALPELNLEDSVFSGINRLLYRPLLVFFLGFTLTLVTMSVSVSLGLLVPLSVRGYIRRENLISYIMGCNVSTFIDTLIAGVLIGNPAAASVVIVQMLTVMLVSAVIILLFFGAYERAVLRIVLWLEKSRLRLIVFFVSMVLIPVGLIVIF